LCFGGCRFLTLLRGEQLSQVDCRRDFLDATLESILKQDSARTTSAHKPQPAP
jgi:uncharacterized protein